MKRITLIIAAGLLSIGFATANAQSASEEEQASRTMAELLELIEQGQSRDSRESRQRESEFKQARNRQQSLLNQARAERTRQENISSNLEQSFEDNQQRIITARQALDERLGALKELFGVLQTVSGDTQGRFNDSLTNIQFPDRGKFLVELGNKMAGASSLASIEDIERLWGMLQREVYESGRVVRFNHLVTRADGEQSETEVIRVGLFNIVSDEGYLTYRMVDGQVSLRELARQPESRFTSTTGDMMGIRNSWYTYF